MFTINADKEYAFASKNKRQVFIRICCLAIGGITFIVTMFVCKQTHAKIYAKILFFSPSTTGLPNLARDVYVSFYLFRLSPMAVGIGLGWAPPIGLPPPISRGGCRKSLADYVSNSLALFLPESLRVNTHLGTSSICQSISETIRCGQSISPPWHSHCNGLRFVTHP